MDAHRWEKIEQIFNEAIELEGTEREQFLARECAGDDELRAQVERLIGRDEEEEEFLEKPVWTDSLVASDLRNRVINYIEDDLPAQPESRMIGRRVGSYELTREIDKGGMGIVYEAQRADGEFSQKVAIKLIKRGMDTDFIVQRFRHERQILASLNHPNIARLIDGGTLDGSPYFVMEFIEGEPLLGFCDKRGLRLEERLQKFLDVCRAISYAHEKMVIHRDIKPGNILVDAGGTPKLLDFGIAKILDPDMVHESISPTATAMRMMTPEYASPEQARGDEITPPSDQYSLGALLYELTTGARPYKFTSRAPHEIARVICDQVPTRPTLATARKDKNATRRNLLINSEIGGELERIILRALAKAPGDRYASVEALAADIEGVLRGDTALAAPAAKTVFRLQPPTGDNEPTAIDTGRGLAPTTGGTPPVLGTSPRWRGVKMGLFIVIGAILFTPILGILGITGTIPLGGLVAILFLAIFSGLLRIVYALFFESNEKPLLNEMVEEPSTLLLRQAETVISTPESFEKIIDAPVEIREEVRAEKPDDKSIAVLPFKGLNPAAEDSAFLGFGIADALVARLSNVKQLVVRPSSSTLRFADSGDSFAVGRELNVRYLLEGNYAVSGTRFRVSVQLLDITKRATVWAERFEEEATDLLALEDIISHKAAEMLVPHLTTGELRDLAKRGTDNLQAQEAYLRGRFHWNSFTQEGLRLAMQFFQQAIQLDSGYALAYAGIADYLVWLGIFGAISPEQSYQKAKGLAMKSISLNPNLPEGHAALGLAQLCGDYDWKAGEASIRKAIDLNPNYAVAHNWLAILLFSAGRFDKGIGHARTAIELDPLTYQNYRTLSWGFYFARRFDDALAAVNRSIEKFPMTGTAYANRSWLLRAMNDPAAALADSEEAVKTSGSNLFVLLGHAQSLALAGRMEEAEGLVADIKTQSPERYVSFYQVALVYCRAGDKAKALDALEQALADREGWMVWLNVEPALDILRAEPRFIAIIEKVKPYGYKPRVEIKPIAAAPAPSTDQTAIAVLPFKMLNMRETLATGEEEFLRIGLADAVTTRLSNVKQLVVRPTSSVRRYDGATTDSFSAGEHLGVDFLIEGTIMKLDDRMRVTIQLLDVRKKSAVWAKRYDNESADILAFEDQLSMLLAESLVPQLTGEERRQLEKRGTDNMEAFEAYLHGRFFWNSLTDEGLQKAIGYFNRAIELDPGYAQAYAAIADYYVMLGIYNVLPVDDFYPAARDAAERAIELDPALSEAYTALALAVLYGEYDWERSARYFEKGIELNPNNPFAHLWSSHCDYTQGNFKKGDRSIARALELDPQSFQVHNTIAYARHFSGDSEAAVAAMDEAIKLFPSNSHAYMGKGNFLNYLGRTDQAIEMMNLAVNLSKGSLFAIYGLSQAYAGAGMREEALNLIERSRSEVGKEYFSLFQIGQIYCYLGEVDNAFEFFERSFEAHESLMVWIAIEPSFDIIRSDERYNDLLKRVGHPLARD